LQKNGFNLLCFATFLHLNFIDLNLLIISSYHEQQIPAWAC
jgi:hypothetical protein